MVLSIDESVFQQQWYHSIELLPGKFTRGQDFNNLPVTRTLLRGCSVEGMTCLDIGAMDFLISLLLVRRGASRTVAYDREGRVKRFNFVKEFFNLDLEYIHGCSLLGLPAAISKIGATSFDVVVFSGVLYHTFDPFGALAICRGLVRNGGLLVVETAAMVADTMSLHFNAAGKYYPGTNYFQVSLDCLDYMLRYLRLEPIDCVYVKQSFRENIVRVGIVCRAVEHCVSEQGDLWMPQSNGSNSFLIDLKDFLNWENVINKGDQPNPHYEIQNSSVSLRKDIGTVDIFNTVISSPPLSYGDQLLKLGLNDRV
jgi:SAM-dependent methyltransferase